MAGRRDKVFQGNGFPSVTAVFSLYILPLTASHLYVGQGLLQIVNGSSVSSMPTDRRSVLSYTPTLCPLLRVLAEMGR